MADVSGSDIQTLIEAMQANTAAILRGKAGSQSQPNKKAADAAEKKLTATKMATKALTDQTLSVTKADKVIKDVKKSLDQLDDSAGAFQKSLVGAGVAASILTGILARELPKTIDTYREMMNVGQDFGGSMLSMNKAAAQSRMSLEDFAKTVKKNSLVVASVGTKTFMDMGVGVRDSLAQLGMLGLTTDELNSYLGSYMETQRQYGHAERITQAQAVDSTRNFVDNVTKFSALTGKSRADIMKATEGAMRDITLSAYQAQLSGDASDKLTKSLGKATAYLAALPGEAGNTMSTMLAQAVGRESAWLSDSASKLSSVGMGAVVDMVDSMAQKIKRGEASDEELDAYRARMVKVGKENMESLRIQAMSSNASVRANAEFSIKFINDMSSLSKKTLKERQAQEAITNTLLRMQDIWGQVTGFIREQFFGALGNVLNGFEESLKTPEFEAFKNQIIGYGKEFGSWLSSMSKSDLWTKLGKALGLVVDGVVLMTNVVTKIVNVFSSVHSALGTFGTALVGLAAYLAITKGVGAVKDKLNQKFDIGPDPFRKYASGGAIRVMMMNGGGRSGGFTDDHWERRQRRNDRVDRGRRAQRVGRVAGVATSRAGKVASVAGGALARGARGVGGAVSGAASRVRNMGALGKGLAGGVGGLMMVGADMALENSGDFTGKATAKLGLAAAQGAAMGAMLGPIGALVGGIAGAGVELVMNWESIVKDVKGVASKAMGAIKSGFDGLGSVFGWIGGKVRGVMNFFYEGIKGSFTSVVDFTSNIGKTIGNTVAGGFAMAGDWLKSNVMDFANSVMSAWDSIKGFDWSGMFSSVGQSVIDTAKFVSPLANMAISNVAKVMNPGGQITSPTDNSTPQIKSVNEKVMESQIKTLEGQVAAMKQDYNELRLQYNKLFDLLSESNVLQKAGLTELVEETRRGNRGIDGLVRKL